MDFWSRFMGKTGTNESQCARSQNGDKNRVIGPGSCHDPGQMTHYSRAFPRPRTDDLYLNGHRSPSSPFARGGTEPPPGCPIFSRARRRRRPRAAGLRRPRRRLLHARRLRRRPRAPLRSPSTSTASSVRAPSASAVVRALHRLHRARRRPRAPPRSSRRRRLPPP